MQYNINLSSPRVSRYQPNLWGSIRIGCDDEEKPPKPFSIGNIRSRFSSCRSCCEQCTVYTFCVRDLTDVYSTRKPKNARSKRALEAREPKEVEDPRTAIFVKGTHTGERLNATMQELVRREHPLRPPSHR